MKTLNEFKYERIKELRQKNNISQKLLGEMLGISDRAVSKWETGLSQPSGKNMICLSKIFNVPVEYFLRNGEGTKNIKNESSIVGFWTFSCY